MKRAEAGTLGKGHVLAEGHERAVCATCVGPIAAALELAERGLVGATNAADEAMSEAVGKRAANWGVINDGLLAASRALKAIRTIQREGKP